MRIIDSFRQSDGSGGWQDMERRLRQKMRLHPQRRQAATPSADSPQEAQHDPSPAWAREDDAQAGPAPRPIYSLHGRDLSDDEAQLLRSAPRTGAA